MPEHASRFAGLYDQQNENRIADWGGDELFTRMPSPPAVDDAPAPRFRPSLVLVDTPAERRRTPPAPEWQGARDRRRSLTAAEAMQERAERVGLAVLEGERSAAERGGDATTPLGGTGGEPWKDATDATSRQWDGAYAADIERWDAVLEPPDERAANGRRTKVITGRPDGAPRPLSLAAAERRRPPRTPAEWIGPRPDRIVAWAFVLGLLLILVAISTADAATL